MANIKSQIKRIRTNEARRLRNMAVRSRLKTMVKRAAGTIEAGDPEKMQAELAQAIITIDRTCSKGVLHPNAAARRKSSLQRRYNQALAAAKS